VDVIDIHNAKRNLQRILVRVKNSQISEMNKNLIMSFYDDCVSSRLSVNRILFYIYKLFRIIHLLGKDLSDATEEDIKEIVRRVELNEDYTEWTKSNYRVTLKKFYKWLEGGKDYPEKVRWIKTGIKKDRTKVINVLSEDDMKRLIDCVDNVRDKAFISVLYESGCRIGEILNVKFGDVKFDDYGAVMLVNGKTGPRRVRLVSSVPRLSIWVEHHPIKHADAPLWVNTGTTNHDKVLMYSNVCGMLRDAARRIGLSVPVNPHAFRHARATHLASKLTEAQMCEYFGWIQGSNMAFTCVHLSGRDIDDAILKLNGKIPKENVIEEFRLKKCPRCLRENPPDSHFCMTCHLPLDEKTAVEIEQRKKEFISTTITNEIIEKMVEEKVRQILSEKIKITRSKMPLKQLLF
jgi:integrase/recombinase XerD